MDYVIVEAGGIEEDVMSFMVDLKQFGCSPGRFRSDALSIVLWLLIALELDPAGSGHSPGGVPRCCACGNVPKHSLSEHMREIGGSCNR